MKFEYDQPSPIGAADVTYLTFESTSDNAGKLVSRREHPFYIPQEHYLPMDQRTLLETNGTRGHHSVDRSIVD